MTDQCIPGLGPALQDVPETSVEWLLWREKVLAYRELIHRLCAEDIEARQEVDKLCEEDAAYFMAVFGVIHEPRHQPDIRIVDGAIEEFSRPPGWYPWIPYGFQVETIRAIDEALADENNELGRGDLLIEKARDMGGTWSLCLHAAHGWKYRDDFIVGFISYREENVDSKMSKSMFFKVEALLGLNTRIPNTCHAPGTIYDGIPLRLPDWMQVSGFDPDEHDLKRNLMHPTKSNQIVGDTTTGTTGTGDRWLYAVIDEAAKIKDLETMWESLAGVTLHRIPLSSAFRELGDAMYTLVDQARRARYNPDLEGARLLSLPWQRHPLRDEVWMRRQKARFSTNPHMFAQEYELDWNAGIGGLVYPYAQNMYPGEFPWEATQGQAWCTIDPGLRDPTAVVWFQQEPASGDYRVVEALVEEIASANYLAPLLMGWPEGHEMRANYDTPHLQEVLDFTWNLRRLGYAITYVGDTFGETVGGGGRDTFYAILTRKCRELCEMYPDLPHVSIAVQTKYDEGARFHMVRKNALLSILPRLKFNNTVWPMYVLRAIQAYRYKEQSSALGTTEPARPVHDWSSHPTTACEFFAVRVTLGEKLRKFPNRKPVRYKRKTA